MKRCFSLDFVLALCARDLKIEPRRASKTGKLIEMHFLFFSVFFVDFFVFFV